MRGAALGLAVLALAACGGRSIVAPRPAPPRHDGGADAGDAPSDRPDAATEMRDAAAADVGGDADAPPAPSFVLAPSTIDCAGYADVSTCVVRVKPGGGAATGSPVGMSWATALGDVQDALDLGGCGCDVWIAAGTYLPTKSIDQPGEAPDPRSKAFVVWPGSTVLGGFAGTETSPQGRPATGSETILSGDLGVAGVRDDNAYHVLVGQDGAALESLTIRDGVANGLGIGQRVGGGVVNLGPGLTLRNVRITDSEADEGGGLFNDEKGHVSLQGCTFARNTADVGGGLILNGGASTIDRSTFADNVGVFMGGGIVQFGGTVELADTKFTRNRSDTGGGAAFSAGDNHLERCWFEANAAGVFGAGFIVRTSATVHVSSSVFVANASAGFGGAVALWTGTLELEASTVVDDFAAMGGAFLVKDGSRLTIGDSLVWNAADPLGRTVYLDGTGNTILAATSDVPADLASATTFDVDPRLANVPRSTRLAQLTGTTGTVAVTDAATIYAPGDRLELGDDGVERKIVSIDDIAVKFAPPWPVETPRFLRVDQWAASAPSLTLDLTPAATSPLLDRASSGAPATDVFGHARVGTADLGAVERVP